VLTLGRPRDYQSGISRSSACNGVLSWGRGITVAGAFRLGAFSLTNVVAIGAGEYHSLAVKAVGSVVAWGDNSQGPTSLPAGLAHVVAAAGGGGHSVALAADGKSRP
jgi:hypothetical protein